MPRDQEMFGIRWPHLEGLGMVEVKRTMNNQTEHSKRFFITSLDDGYEILLKSDLPKGAMPGKNKIYVEQIGGVLLRSQKSGVTLSSLLSLLLELLLLLELALLLELLLL